MRRSPDQLLIVALSGRALAYLARRAWMTASVLDVFGDVDTVGYAVSWEKAGDICHGFDRELLLPAAERLCPSGRCAGLVYGSGFESCPQLLAELSVGRELYGNDSDVVSACVSPQRFFATLDRLSIPHPMVCDQRPADCDGWLAKRVGASGGGHVVRAEHLEDARGYYFQRETAGQVLSVLFLADSRKAYLIGINAQINAGSPQQPYCYGGAVSGQAVSAELRAELLEAATLLTGALGLRGINGLDVIVDRNAFYVLELNARPTATTELYAELGGECGLLRWHVRACRGELPPPGLLEPRGRYYAHRVVYARRQLVVPAGFVWPPWCSDRPREGAAVGSGEPLCTVQARAPGQAGVRTLLERRYRHIHDALVARDIGDGG